MTGLGWGWSGGTAWVLKGVLGGAIRELQVYWEY
jgi:hypothetical protein